MHYTDLREFIAVAEELGELKVVEGADWDKELGVINELMTERKGPAVLFDNIKGYPKGYRVLGNPFGSVNRTAMALLAPLNLKPIEVLDTWRRNLRKFKPLPPAEVHDAPVKENIIMGKEIDLYKLPAPFWHEHDGGRYIGTGTALITRDPDEGWYNLGAHRCMIWDKDLLSAHLAEGHHCRIHMDKYHAKGQSCPVAISLGGDPVLYVAAGQMLTGWGVSEYEYAGWARNEPVKVVRGEATDLLIPASAEIVIEGEIPPLSEMDLRMDGPFGEWPGYYSQNRSAMVKVKSILHRNDPIILGAPPLRPPAPWHFAVPLTAGLVWNALEDNGVSGVTGVWMGLTAWGPLWLVVGIRQQYAGHPKHTALAATGCRPGCYGGKWVIVVDHDIDITNTEEVVWAMMTRTNAENLEIIRGVWTSPADIASITPEAKALRQNIGAKVIVDACFPFSRSKEFIRTTRFSPSYKERVLNKWSNLFPD